jgi:hypothetical protein
MCYRQTPSQHTQDAQRQQAKDDTERKARDYRGQRQDGVDRSPEEVREEEMEVE